MKEEFEKLAASGKISARHIETLNTLAQTGYCVHKSWGFGRITTVDTVFARFLIDFPNKPGHQMDLGFAAESLKAVSPDHILAKKASDLEGLRKLAALDHLAVIKMVLQSYGGRATVDQVQQVLVPDVITVGLEKMVGGGEARVEEGRPFPGSRQKNRAHHLSDGRSFVTGSFAEGISRGQRFESAHHCSP